MERLHGWLAVWCERSKVAEAPSTRFEFKPASLDSHADTCCAGSNITVLQRWFEHRCSGAEWLEKPRSMCCRSQLRMWKRIREGRSLSVCVSPRRGGGDPSRLPNGTWERCRYLVFRGCGPCRMQGHVVRILASSYM
jgi:hypothetical protein